MLGDIFISNSGLYCPQVCNIEMDPHEDMNVGGINLWPREFASKPVKAYLESLKTCPTPPVVNLTNFSGR